MATEFGHHTGRAYIDQEGNFHLNGALFYNDAEEDVSVELEQLEGVAGALAAFDTLSATEIGYLDGAVAGTAAEGKALILGTSKAGGEVTSMTITTLTSNAIAAGDASLGIDGLAATSATGGAIIVTGGATTTGGVGGLASLRGGAGAGADLGGAATVNGGLGGATNAIGGAATVTAGAGQGTAAGAIAGLVGGQSGTGATGNGGVSRVIGGAAASVDGTGGAAQATGGIATGTGTGGAVTLTGGASAGAGGTAGSVNLASGAPTSGTDGGVNIQTVTTGKVGFFGITAVVRQSAYTQTFATADKTHSAATQIAATAVANVTGATENYEFQDTSATVTQAEARVFLKTIYLLFGQVKADIDDVKRLCNSIIDDGQAYGLLA